MSDLDKDVLQFKDAEDAPAYVQPTTLHASPPSQETPSFNLHIDESSFIQEEDTPEEEHPQVKLRDVLLPDGIHQRVIKQYITAILVTLFTIVTTIYYQRIECVIGLAIAGVLVYLGISTKMDFAEGKITELPLVCVSVNSPLRSKITRVVFRTQNENAPQYFEFSVPGKHQKDFIPNSVYVVYFREENPKELLGYTQL